MKVALQVDPSIDRPGIKNRPVQSIYERHSQLVACKYIDEILLYDTEDDLLNLIKSQTMHIRFLSEEYMNRDFTGKEYCLNNGIEIHYHKRQHNFSSSELRNRIHKLELEKLQEKYESPIPPHSIELLKTSKK